LQPAMIAVTAPHRHPSRWLATAATILIVAAVAAGPVLLHRAAKHANPAANTQQVPKSITVNGQPAPLLGELSWTYAITDPADPRTIYVYAASAGLGNCGPHSLRAFVTGTDDDAVSVTVAGFRIPGCGGDVHYSGTSPVPVALPTTLGTRIATDRGATRTLLHAEAKPFLRSVPSGYEARAPQWMPLQGAAPAVNDGYIVETYTAAHGGILTLLNYQCCPPESPGQDRQSVTINAITGTAFQSSPPGAFVTVEWSPGGQSMLRLTSSGAHHLTVDQLVTVARSVQ
jgi:hypothetical protein